MSSIAATQQNLYATVVAATSAANKARAGNAMTDTGNTPGTSATNSTSVSVSQQAQNLAATSQASSSSSGSYDFTNMTPIEMGKLVSDGKITGGFFVFTEAQFQAGMQANLKGLTGKARQDLMDVANNTPANYIQLYTKGIQDSKRFGIDTTGLESILHQMEALQGTPATTTSA
jgi:hypothetical protein